MTVSQHKGTRHEPPHYEDFGFAGVAAHRKLGSADPTFRFLRWRASDDGASILDGAPTRKLKSGPRKGKDTFNGPTKIVVVSRAEEHAEEVAYERETGFCSRCAGSGRVFAKWDHVTGSWYKDCSVCNGTGKASANG